jgi:hypothetical protein
MTRLLLLFLLFLLSPAHAQREGKVGKVAIVVISQDVTETSSPKNDLVHVKVRLTNTGESAIVYTNNRFVLTDSAGGNHLVNRGWYPQGAALQPGESVEIDRVYFEIPKGTKPVELSLMWRRFILGTVKLKS